MDFIRTIPLPFKLFNQKKHITDHRGGISKPAPNTLKKTKMTWKDINPNEPASVFRIDYMMNTRKYTNIKPWAKLVGKERQKWRKRYLIKTGQW